MRLNSLGAALVQRRNACRKLAASLKPNALAISSTIKSVSRKYLIAISIRSSSTSLRNDVCSCCNFRRSVRALMFRLFAMLSKLTACIRLIMRLCRTFPINPIRRLNSSIRPSHSPSTVEYVISFPRFGVPSSQAASNKSLFSDWPNSIGEPKMSEYFGASAGAA